MLTVTALLLGAVTMIQLCGGMPIVDPGVFVIQGISSCLAGTGYCMLGKDCMADIDFMDADDTQHCDGLKEAFTPSVPFTCCQFNERGKASSEAPTTEVSSFTITGDDFLLQEIPILEHQETNEIPEGVDPSSLIDIIGVITDMTGVLGLVTQPYTVPAQSTAATTLTSTTTPMPGIPMQTNSSHASISLVGFLNNLMVTTNEPLTTTTTTQAASIPPITTTTQTSTLSFTISLPSSAEEQSETPSATDVSNILLKTDAANKATTLATTQVTEEINLSTVNRSALGSGADETEIYPTSTDSPDAVNSIER